jgi:hypothetical protein
MDNKKTAKRSGKAIGGGDLWRVMRAGECLGTIVHSKVTDYWHTTRAGGKPVTHETQAEAFAYFGVGS